MSSAARLVIEVPPVKYQFGLPSLGTCRNVVGTWKLLVNTQPDTSARSIVRLEIGSSLLGGNCPVISTNSFTFCRISSGPANVLQASGPLNHKSCRFFAHPPWTITTELGGADPSTCR